MKQGTGRGARIAEEIRKVVSQLLHFELSDPRLEGVSITEVRMTPELSIARVNFTIPGAPERAAEAIRGFKSCSGLLRRAVAREINLKFAPQFEFYYDESIELQEKIDSLFDQIKK